MLGPTPNIGVQPVIPAMAGRTVTITSLPQQKTTAQQYATLRSQSPDDKPEEEHNHSARFASIVSSVGKFFKESTSWIASLGVLGITFFGMHKITAPKEVKVSAKEQQGRRALAPA